MREDAFDRALRRNHVGVADVQRAPDVRHVLADRIEVVVANELPARFTIGRRDAARGRVRADRPFHRVSWMAFARQHRGLQKVVLRQARFQHEMLGHLELTARQRARLVRTDHRRRSERLHAREPADEHAARGQPPGAHRQKQREHDRKLLGDRGHRQADGAEQRARPRFTACEAQREECDGHNHGDDTEAPDEHGRLLLQRTG